MHSQANPEPEITLHADVELPSSVTMEGLTSLVSHVLRREDVAGDWQMGIRFVDDATMQAAHVEFMDIDEPTDIMTFPYEDEDDFWTAGTPDGPAGVSGGDLIISVDRAADNARAAGWETSQEILFLVIHGVLHLLGWDDATEQERTAMLDRQSVLLTEWRESPEARR